MKKYYKIDASIDNKIIGKSESPLTVQIKNKTFSEHDLPPIYGTV